MNGLRLPARCPRHPRRRATVLAAGRLVCAECAAGAPDARPVPESALVWLPVPQLLQAGSEVHIADQRIKDVGPVARCGRVLADGAVLTGAVPPEMEPCAACGGAEGVRQAQARQADWRTAAVLRTGASPRLARRR